MATHQTREERIEDILRREFAMFSSVRARGPAVCQQDPEGFRIMRAAQFSVWSDRALASYLQDLVRAAETGRNLMTLKYARMEDLVPPLHDNPLTIGLLDRIVDIQLGWQREMASRYPNLMATARPLDADGSGQPGDAFVTYLRAELETYSEETLLCLEADISAYRETGRNMSEAIYLAMVRGLGYDSLEDAEARAAARRAGR